MDTAAPSTVDAGLSSKCVLLIDDHAPLRTRVKELLNAEFPGLSVREASCGEEAYAQVDREAPGLVLLDLRLPGLDGFSVLAGLRDRRPDVPIIVLSALPTVPYASVVSRLGAVGYVSKAALPGDLLRVLRLALAAPSGDEVSNDNARHDHV
jgi:DNA-binding NarL/FixJ family response regulator